MYFLPVKKSKSKKNKQPLNVFLKSFLQIKYIMALDSVMVSDVMDDVITPAIENDEVELLIIASIQTLKRKNKRCGRDEVFELVKDSTDDDTVTKETFDKLLNQLINNNSVKLNFVGNRECLSLPTKSNKKNQQSHIEDPLNVENCFTNLKYVITDEFESLKNLFYRKLLPLKMNYYKQVLQRHLKITQRDR